MRLNWFSPLPPAPTEIAHHTTRVLVALRRARAEVVLWTDQEEWEAALERHAEVRRYDPERMNWRELNRADLTVYNLGNDPRYHGPTWLVSRLHPGLVVLHDLCLQHFFAGLYRDVWRDRPGFLDIMGRYYGAAGRRDAEHFWDGGYSTDHLAELYPLTPLALENALGALVHTAESFERVKEEQRLPVVCAPLPYAATRRAKIKRRRGDAPPFRLVIFGHIGANRRLEAVLQALAALPERDKFRLDIYGKVWKETHLRTLIRSFDLEASVAVRGFVPASELDDALASAHLAINLRYPTMGEASASQLRIWDHALPSLVTRVGHYATLPADAVAHVRPEREVEDIQRHLRAFLSDPPRFARMGERGRLALEELHAPENYARAVVDFAAGARAHGLRALADETAARAGRAAGAWMNGKVLDNFSVKAARQIHAALL